MEPRKRQANLESSEIIIFIRRLLRSLRTEWSCEQQQQQQQQRLQYQSIASQYSAVCLLRLIIYWVVFHI